MGSSFLLGLWVIKNLPRNDEESYLTSTASPPHRFEQPVELVTAVQRSVACSRGARYARKQRLPKGRDVGCVPTYT